jgi:hypothetical protein
MDDLETIELIDDIQQEFETEFDSEEPEVVIKCILFKNGIYIISFIEELLVDFGQPNCKLINPRTIKSDSLERWPLHTDQEELIISSENFLTIYEPSAILLERYMKTVGE